MRHAISFRVSEICLNNCKITKNSSTFKWVEEFFCCAPSMASIFDGSSPLPKPTGNNLLEVK